MEVPMSKYNLEINYLLLGIDISPEELAEINAESDKIIAKNTENPEKTTEAYLKKSQCLQKMERYEESRGPIQKALDLFPDMIEALVQFRKKAVIIFSPSLYDRLIIVY
jgi:tetratricopeptide (TPR) repeat protein